MHYALITLDFPKNEKFKNFLKIGIARFRTLVYI